MRYIVSAMRNLAIAVVFATSIVHNARTQHSEGSDPDRPNRVVIEFANLGGIRDWRPGGSADSILIEGRNGQWYRATFMNHCPEVNFRDTVAFVTDATGDLTRFGSVLAGGRQCYFKTFERTSPPDEMPSGFD